MAMVRRRVGGFVRATNNINLVVTGHSGNNITITVPAGLSVSEGMIIVFRNNFGINSTSNPSIYANRIYYVRNPNPSPITDIGTINVSLAPAAISSVVWPVNTGTAVTGISIPAVAGDSIGMTYYLNTSPLSADQVVPTPGVFNLAKQAQMVKSGIWPEDLTKTMTGNALVVGGGGNGGQYNGGGGGGVYNGSVSFRKSIWFLATLGGGGGTASQISGYGFDLTANGGGAGGAIGGSSGTVILNTNTVLASGYAGGLNPSKILNSYQTTSNSLNPAVSNPSYNNNFTDTYTYSGNASAGGGGGGSGAAGVNGAVSPVAPVTTAPASFAGGIGGSGSGGYGGGGGAGGFAYNVVNFKRVSAYFLTQSGINNGATAPPGYTTQTTTYAHSAFGSTIGGTGGGGGSASTFNSVVNNSIAPLNNSSTTTYNLNPAIAGGANTGGGGGGGAYAGVSPQIGGANGGSGQLRITIPAERYNVTYPYINTMSTTLSTTNVTLTGSGKFAV